ncbi:type II secretion system protein J [Altericista sp. CCNU0014]|uniref:PulJ/GspJ family protein n=1 Tax=Altericista sp. CCNU0014 TaxID=3082949 RepID=UPI00384B07B0
MNPTSASPGRMHNGLLYLLARSPFQALQQRGFTLIEVLAALTISMIFVSLTMQMMVAAAFFRSKGGQYNQAFNWIQQDYEKVFSKATEYENSVTPYSSKCLATTPDNGLAAGFLNDATLGLGGTAVTLGTTTLSGKSFTLTRTASYASSDDPYRLVRINYAVAPASGGAAIVSIDTEVVLYAGFKCPG